MVNNVVVRVLTNTSVRVSWDRLLISEITQYKIFFNPTGNRNSKRQTAETAMIVDSTESSVDITGLTTGVEYQFQVVAQALVEGEIIMGQRSSLTYISILDVVVAALSCSSPASLGEGLSMSNSVLQGVAASYCSYIFQSIRYTWV